MEWQDPEQHDAESSKSSREPRTKLDGLFLYSDLGITGSDDEDGHNYVIFPCLALGTKEWVCSKRWFAKYVLAILYTKRKLMRGLFREGD